MSSAAQPLNAENDNVDVEVRLGDGSRWSATFFTLDNIDALFAKNRVTGECAKGLSVGGGHDPRRATR